MTFWFFRKSSKADGYSNLISPVSNLVSPENFEFTVEVDVDKNYLKPALIFCPKELKLNKSNKRIFTTSAILVAVILALFWLVFFWESERVKKMSEDYQKEKLNSFVIQEKKNDGKSGKRNSRLQKNTDESQGNVS